MFDKKMALAAKRTLTKARKLIEKPERWGKGAFYMDKKGEELYTGYEWRNGDYVVRVPKLNQVGSFCALGAIKKADGPGENAAEEFLADAIHSLTHKGKRRSHAEIKVYTFNDRKETTHEMILDAFDRAIALAEAEAQQ